MKAFAASTVLALLLAARPGPAAEKVHLAYLCHQGEPMRCQVEFVQEWEVRGYFYSTRGRLQLTVVCRETEGDSAFVMEATVDKASIATTRDEELMDSDLDDQIQGKRIDYRLRPTGEVSEVDSPDYIEDWDKAESFLAVVLGGIYPYLPGEEREVGGEYEVEPHPGDSDLDVEVEVEGKMHLKKKVKKKGRLCVEIEGKAKGYVHGRFEGEMGTVIMDGPGTDKCKFYFDPARGVVVELEREEDFDLTIISASESTAEERKAEQAGLSMSFKMKIQ